MRICIVGSLDRWLEFGTGTLTSYGEPFGQILDTKPAFRSSTQSFHSMILNATVIPCVGKILILGLSEQRLLALVMKVLNNGHSLNVQWQVIAKAAKTSEIR